MQECSRGPSRSSRSSFIDVPDSSDDDLESRDEPKKKRWRCDDDSWMLQRLNDEVASIRDMLSDMMSLTANTNTFKCQICHAAPVRPPVIVTKCCRKHPRVPRMCQHMVLGEAMTKTCPLCRTERGCNKTMVLRGLTDFMEISGGHMTMKATWAKHNMYRKEVQQIT